MEEDVVKKKKKRKKERKKKCHLQQHRLDLEIIILEQVRLRKTTI